MTVTERLGKRLPIAMDCEQSLFFFRFSQGSARARKLRDERSEGAYPVSRLQSRAWLLACLARFARRNKEKERLLVVY